MTNEHPAPVADEAQLLRDLLAKAGSRRSNSDANTEAWPMGEDHVFIPANNAPRYEELLRRAWRKAIRNGLGQVVLTLDPRTGDVGMEVCPSLEGVDVAHMLKQAADFKGIDLTVGG